MVSNWSVSEGSAAEDVRRLSPGAQVAPLLRPDRPPSASKGTELRAIVDRLGLAPRPTQLDLPAPLASPLSPVRSKKVSRDCRRKRRKPLQTRKVVPYQQYLSMLRDDQAWPLDLSRRSPSPVPSFRGDPPPAGSLLRLPSMAPTPAPSSSALAAPSGHVKKPAPVCPTTVTSERDGVRNQFPPTSGWEMRGTAAGEAEERRGGPRAKARSNQRTIIRKKLEDTFRQNGFLVKTKQVSDGEATFCKFRQLKKYTRYYLKSWQDHLPEEVHKLWKGFLPPKTAIPAGGGGKREECTPTGD